MDPPAPPPPDRRAPRRRVLRTGIITYNDGAISFRCQVRDRSEHGARLKLPPGLMPPIDFWLIEITDALAHRAHAVWRRGDEIGVELSDTQNIQTPGSEIWRRQLHALWVAAAAS